VLNRQGPQKTPRRRYDLSGPSYQEYTLVLDNGRTAPVIDIEQEVDE
jgi:hypothetical protein